jgi:PAS domain S-box-containing protein
LRPRRTGPHRPGTRAVPINLIDVANIVTDLRGVIQSCNPAAERLLGYTSAELIGQSIKTLVPPELQAEEDDLTERVRAGEPLGYSETIRIAKGGRRISVALTAASVHDASGTVVGTSRILRDITEQQRAAAAQAYLAAIVESSDDAILSKDLDGIIQSCNASAERLFGYTAAELIGRPVRILIPQDRQREEDEILARIRRGERIDHFETVRVAKDGRLLDISLTVSPVHDESGAIIGVSKVARDVTEHKRAAAELAAQQEWFRVTLGSIADAVIASNSRGDITYMNAQAEGLTGWTVDAAQGRPLLEVFHIVDEQTRQPADNPADLVMRVQTAVGLAGHVVLIGRDGTERLIADSAAPIRDGDGLLLGVVLVFRDVTEERRGEEAIAEQREWFKTTLESIGDAVIATDVGERIVFMNTVAEHLTGWRSEAACGRVCTDVYNIVNEQTRSRVQSPVKRVLYEGEVAGLANDTLLIAADGTERPIQDSGAPIRNRDGHIIGVVLVFRDITERRRSDAERRTAEAERERLLEAERAARAEAERASRVKDEFVAMVSHELRTPLNAILGWTQLMKKDRQDAVVQERGLDIVARNTRLQAQLISDLLDISRIVSGKLQVEFRRVDLASIVADAIETVQPDATFKGIEIRRDLDGDLGPIAGDPSRLQQAVWNLLSNAIKFTPSGGRVAVALRRSNHHAEITVTDTGVGIRPEVLPHVFDRFHQADRSITRRFGGLGLGLSIVKHLVELHGGDVSADSAGDGKGARFTIRLPASAAPPHGVAVQAGIALRDTFEPVSLDGIRILVVEDEPDTREFLKRLLESNGAAVVLAGSATEALTAFENAPPEVLISDIGLPDVDGYDLMRLIRKKNVKCGGAVPAVALTAYARSEDRTRALRAGYQAYVVKPVEANELLATIASFVDLADARQRR